MKLAAYALAAALIGAMGAGSANAMPSSSVPAKAAFQSETNIHVVDHRRDHRGKGDWRGKPGKKYGKRHGKHRYRAGGRYSTAPSGWHRYNSRPSYWQTRGCIVVGPVWFCP